MSSSDKKYFGESKLSKTPEKRFIVKIKDGSITTEKIADDAITKDKIADHAITLDKLGVDIYNIYVRPYFESLQNQISSITSASGYAMSTIFGDDNTIGVSQKTLTDAFNKIWEKLEDITGESYVGIDMTVTPTYFTGNDGATVSITANTVATNGIFEHIAIYIDGVQIDEADNVESFSTSATISDTAIVMCKATIMGIEYTRQATIAHYDSFWVGAGDTYSDVMTAACLVSVDDDMRAVTDVTCTSGKHIIIVMGSYLSDGFIRADINGVEIPFTESTATVDGNTYKVLTSVNTYQAGTYNIDING